MVIFGFPSEGNAVEDVIDIVSWKDDFEELNEGEFLMVEAVHSVRLFPKTDEGNKFGSPDCWSEVLDPAAKT